MMALLIIASVVFFSRDRRFVPWLITAGGVIGMALVAAMTRSMWAGAACGGVYLLWFWKRWTVMALPVCAAILVLVNHSGSATASDLFFSRMAMKIRIRIATWCTGSGGR